MKGKSQSFPVQSFPFILILTSWESLKYGLLIIAIPITCLKDGLYVPDLNSPIKFFVLSYMSVSYTHLRAHET